MRYILCKRQLNKKEEVERLTEITLSKKQKLNASSLPSLADEVELKQEVQVDTKTVEKQLRQVQKMVTAFKTMRAHLGQQIAVGKESHARSISGGLKQLEEVEGELLALLARVDPPDTEVKDLLERAS